MFVSFVLATSALGTAAPAKAPSPVASVPSAYSYQADDSEATGGTIPVQVVAGRLVVSCDLATAAQRIPANLFLEVEGRHGLQLHNRAAGALRAESPDGTPRPIDIRFSDFSITVPRRELGDEDLFEEFTKYHSAEIGENALVGSIGVEILKDWTLRFDVGRGAIHLAPPVPVDATSSPLVNTTFVESDGTVVAPLTLIDDMAWLPVRWNGGDPAGLMLGSAVYDTRIDQRMARAAGKAAGDVGPIRIGGIDLHGYVAFRPEAVIEVHPDRALGITGINLLEQMEITIDRERRELRLRPTGPPEFPAVDLEFFRARAAEDVGAITTFLEAHGEARLAAEAARLLLDYRLEDGAEDAEVRSAVRWMYDTMAGDLRTTRMLDLMKEMADAGEPGVVLAAGELGVDAGRDDRYPNAVHEVHGIMGRTLMDGGSSDEAWRHLLSAAFGMPEDGRINYDLGRFYEGQGRYRRAYSRYVQAVIKPDSGGQAIEALQRVQPLLTGGEGAFSVDKIERMIAGKVRNFGASSTFVPTDEEPAYRTVLCEFFTNGHLGNEERGGAIGGALGFEGLISHFPPDRVVFLEYHLPAPRPDALCSAPAGDRAAQLGVGDPAVIVIDGDAMSPGAGKWRDAEAIYGRARTAVIARLGELGGHEIDATATLEEGRITGVVTAFGSEEPDVGIQVVVVEAGVLYPGSSGVVVHRHVVRGYALPGGAPIPFTPDEVDDEMSFPFEVHIEDVEAAWAEHLDQLESDGVGAAPRISMRMDPNQTRIVAYLHDMRSGTVLAACEVTPEGVVSEDREVELAPAGESR